MGKIYDIVGVGFGPSNLALAVALEDMQDNKNLSALFLEQKKKFTWHPHMLLDGAEMQISFLKDLATLSNPSSQYTFLNYLHTVGRLALFANLRSFYPSRIEFNDYFSWVSKKLKNYVKYSCRVVDIIPHGNKPYQLLKIIFEDSNLECSHTTSVLTKNVVVASGGIPTIPTFVKRKNNSQRVWHSAEYLQKIEKFKKNSEYPYHFCVVGGGQSAAEVAYDLYQTFPAAKITCVYRGFGYKVADDSEFTNEIFGQATVDLFFSASENVRKKLLEAHGDTNYSVVDPELIQKLYRIKYEESVKNCQRLQFKRLSSLEGVLEEENVEIEINNFLLPSQTEMLHVDAAILATGYSYPNPPPALETLSEHFINNQLGMPLVTRYHQVETDAQLKAGIYLQGYNESTHGLSDTLLSLSSIRANEILDQIILSNKHLSKEINLKEKHTLIAKSTTAHEVINV
jgi:L-ornithine N5-monooxygenase